MIKLISNKNGENVPSFSFPSIWSVDMAATLRDAMADILHNIVSYAEPKEATNPYSLYLLTEMINELTNDIENFKKERR